MRWISSNGGRRRATGLRATALALVSVAALTCGGDRINVGPVKITPETSNVPAALQVHAQVPAQGMIRSAHAMSLAARVGGLPVKASWTYIDGMPGLNAQLDSWLLGALDAKAAASGERYRPAMALNTRPATAIGPGTTLTAEPVAASGRVIVFRETENDTLPNGTSSVTSQTVYADTNTGQVHRAADLLRPEALPRIHTLLFNTAGHSPKPLPNEAAPLDIVLDDQGALRITTAQTGTGNRPARTATATIPAQEAESALGEFGRNVLSQLRSHAPVELPPAASQAFRHVNCDVVPCAALTYDDGPDPRSTPRLLAILREKKVSATFFMLGIRAAANPAIARQVSNAGHAVGNHTYSHANLTMLSAAGIMNEIGRAQASIQAATGSAPTFMRPPYGATNAIVRQAVGLPLVNWSVDSLDWLSRDPKVFVPKVLQEITPGAIVIMHDIHATTIAGQTWLITALQSQGYHLVNVPELFEGTPLVTGQTYRSRPQRW